MSPLGLYVGILHLRRGAGVHRSAVALVLGDELAQAVVHPLRLRHDVATCGGIVGGHQVGVALAVVGGLHPANRPVHTTAQRRHGIADHPAQDIVGQRVRVAVAVRHHQRLAEGIDQHRFLLAAGTGSGAVIYYVEGRTQ